MRFTPVKGPLCFVHCIGCGCSTGIGEGAEKYRNSPAVADLDGEAFKAYYCPTCLTKIDNWIPACGGTEVPFVSRLKRRLLYVWQPSTGNHGYINLDTDTLLTPEEMQAEQL